MAEFLGGPFSQNKSFETQKVTGSFDPSPIKYSKAWIKKNFGDQSKDIFVIHGAVYGEFDEDVYIFEDGKWLILPEDEAAKVKAMIAPATGKSPSIPSSFVDTPKAEYFKVIAKACTDDPHVASIADKMMASTAKAMEDKISKDLGDFASSKPPNQPSTQESSGAPLPSSFLPSSFSDPSKAVKNVLDMGAIYAPYIPLNTFTFGSTPEISLDAKVNPDGSVGYKSKGFGESGVANEIFSVKTMTGPQGGTSFLSAEGEEEAAAKKIAEDKHLEQRLMGLKVKRRHLIRKLYFEAIKEYGTVVKDKIDILDHDGFVQKLAGSHWSWDMYVPSGIAHEEHILSLSFWLKSAMMQVFDKMEDNPGVIFLAISPFWFSLMGNFGWQKKPFIHIPEFKPIKTCCVVVTGQPPDKAYILDRHPSIAEPEHYMGIFSLLNHV